MDKFENDETGLHDDMNETIIQTEVNTSIKIIDNFFSNKILIKIMEYLKTIHWKCQCNKDPNINLCNDTPYWRIELENNIFFNSELKNIIENYFFCFSKDILFQRTRKKNVMDGEFLKESIYFKNAIKQSYCLSKTNIKLKNDNLVYDKINNNNMNLKLKRIYMVGQTYGQDSNFHIDDDYDNTITFCLYINSPQYINDDGLFYLRIPNEKYFITIDPLMNRAIIFPSNYRHKGCGLNRFNDNIRICIAWKFEIINI